MKTFSIVTSILMVLSVFMVLDSISILEPVLDNIEILGAFTNELEEFSDEVYGVVGWALILSILGSVYSIMVYVKLRKQAHTTPTEELMELGKLRERGILSEDEFDARKREIMMQK